MVAAPTEVAAVVVAAATRLIRPRTGRVYSVLRLVLSGGRCVCVGGGTEGGGGGVKMQNTSGSKRREMCLQFTDN